MEVWVVETGDYEQRGIFGVYSTREKAIEYIKLVYGHPYIVTWEAIEDGLVGHFEAVPNYSSKDTCYFDIERYEVDAIKQRY